MIKAMFFDLDGTLLNSAGQISIKTKQVLAQCAQKGIHLFVATARPPFAPEKLPWDEQTMQLFTGGLYCNGGSIEIGGKEYFAPVPKEIVQGVIDIVLRYEGLNGVLQLEQYQNAFIRPELGWQADPTYFSFATTGEAQALRTLKMLLFYGNFHDTKERIGEKLLKEIEAICVEKAQVYVTDFGKAIQINATGITKASSVAKICEIIGITPSETATFGDDTNDMQMISECPNGFAMENAPQEVKNIAAYITKSNDDNGIAYAITDILKCI